VHRGDGRSAIFARGLDAAVREFLIGTKSPEASGSSGNSGSGGGD
jgi:hypothetical protein